MQTERPTDAVFETAPSQKRDTSPPRDVAESARLAHVRRARRLRRLFVIALLASALALVVAFELHTSTLQSRLFADIGTEVYYHMGDGPASTNHFPDVGPYDNRLGYTALPRLANELSREGFAIERQARVSPRFHRVVKLGLFPPYHEKTRAGLTVLDTQGHRVHRARYPGRIFGDFDDIPPLVVRTVLFVENRSLLDKERPRANPALEWQRFVRAVLELAGHRLGLTGRPSGGSTLATQMEKFRHSEDGRTETPSDKLRQMTTASLRAYRRGERTLEAQRQIVTDYLDSVPLAGIHGFGEVIGLLDGLRVWYGSDPAWAMNQLHAASAHGTNASDPNAAEQARAYRQVLSLVLAHRRPSFYLRAGHDDLAKLTDAYLRILCDHGVISEPFRDLAMGSRTPLNRRFEPPDDSEAPKISEALRTHLIERMGVDSLYALDRYDLTVETTVDLDVQYAVERMLERLSDPDYVAAHGLDKYRLLDRGDLDEVVYSFTLYERQPDANLLRIQADTFEGPFNINEGVKLDLGSTAKLRTLASYLEIIARLHARYAALSDDELDELTIDRQDRLSRWAVRWLRQSEDRSLKKMLETAMNRRYSASSSERFFTGGGLHHFSNFSYRHEGTHPTVGEALRNSINLPFIRIIRDVVRWHMFNMPGSDPAILMNADAAGRTEYLQRFADREGKVFLGRFFDKYDGFSFRQSLIRMVGSRSWTPKQLAAAYRTVAPDVDVYTFNHFLRETLEENLSWELVRDLYTQSSPERWDLNDLGYISDVHPLELWLIRYRRHHPDASWNEVVAASADERQLVYEWLFKTSRKHAQNRRIRIMLEVDAFEQLHRQWHRLGYPFERLVPSYASAIGTSADRPAALAELMGIIVNDGLRMPVARVKRLHFASGTPYETEFVRAPSSPERVLPAEVASVLREAVYDVVKNGTGRRLQRYAPGGEETPWRIGGKTGTGDHRHERRDSHGRLISSRPVNRTATFVFQIEERFFGTITAYVAGDQAGDYRFTSSLPVSILGLLAPTLEPLFEIDSTPPAERSDGPVVVATTQPSRPLEVGATSGACTIDRACHFEASPGPAPIVSVTETDSSPEARNEVASTTYATRPAVGRREDLSVGEELSVGIRVPRLASLANRRRLSWSLHPLSPQQATATSRSTHHESGRERASARGPPDSPFIRGPPQATPGDHYEAALQSRPRPLRTSVPGNSVAWKNRRRSTA